jgi:hypothetical protein
MSALNKAKFQQFVKQARGQRLTELHVLRVNKKGNAVLQYNGRAPKVKSRSTGEWTIVRADRSDDEVNADIKAFLELARKHFFVTRGEGLEDDVFADEAMEKKATPIVASESSED